MVSNSFTNVTLWSLQLHTPDFAYDFSYVVFWSWWFCLLLFCLFLNFLKFHTHQDYLCQWYNNSCYCLVAKSHPTLLWPYGLHLPSSAVHGISQARILEQIAISLSRGSSLPRDQTHVSCIDRQMLFYWDIREVCYDNYFTNKIYCKSTKWFLLIILIITLDTFSVFSSIIDCIFYFCFNLLFFHLVLVTCKRQIEKAIKIQKVK